MCLIVLPRLQEILFEYFRATYHSMNSIDILQGYRLTPSGDDWGGLIILVYIL